jgi:cytochrome P450
MASRSGSTSCGALIHSSFLVSPQLIPSSRSDATINLLIAGRDTTAGTLAWTIFELLRNPSLVEGIRRDAAKLDDPTELPFDSLKEMNWTSAVFYEGARLYPTVPNVSS